MRSALDGGWLTTEAVSGLAMLLLYQNFLFKNTSLVPSNMGGCTGRSGHIDGNTKNWNPSNPVTTGTQLMWEIGFLLISFLSQRKTTLYFFCVASPHQYFDIFASVSFAFYMFAEERKVEICALNKFPPDSFCSSVPILVTLGTLKKVLLMAL